MIISNWIESGDRVLDLGCGRGILLEHLQRRKGCRVIGVDSSFSKIVSCVKRGVSSYHGSIKDTLCEFPDKHFDWVVCSRTLQELEQPKEVIMQALRVGKRVAIGFVNSGYWLNRVAMFRYGRRVRNEVNPHLWQDNHPSNPLTVGDFKEFCQDNGITLARSEYLSGDWRSHCKFLPNLFSGYVLMEINKAECEQQK